MTKYVYSLDAVRSRLRRGEQSVLFFLPSDGHPVQLTRSNWKRKSKLIKKYLESFSLSPLKDSIDSKNIKDITRNILD